MSKKQEFVKFIDEQVNWDEAADDIKEYWELFKGKDAEKPLFTDNGKLILKFLQYKSGLLFLIE